MIRRFSLLPIAIGFCVAACAALPTGPDVMVLPGSGKTLEQFSGDDGICRQWAAQQTGITTSKASTESIATGAAVGTVLGAAGGAAIGAAAGNPAMGAAAGSGVGLLGGTAVGANNAQSAEWTLQHRYDVAYMQCMYTKGNQIPVPAGSQPGYERLLSRQQNLPSGVPPPPSGVPPPPPSGPSR
jgi:Glycine-zipper domain